MTREEKLSKIYEVIADKTLSVGCRIERNGNSIVVIDRICEVFNDSYISLGKGEATARLGDKEYGGNYFEIIGHPVMIGDVLDWAKYSKKTMLTEYNNGYKLEGSNSWVGDLLIDWELPRKPIDDQPDDCIHFVYNLCVSND